VASPFDVAWANEVEQAILGTAHPWQYDGITDPARFIGLCVGRGGGKTTMYKGRFMTGIVRKENAKFLYVAPTLGSAIELLWEPVKETVTSLGLTGDFEFKEAPREGGKIMLCKRTRSRLKLCGAEDRKDLEKYRGQPFDGVGVDECGSWSPELLDWFVDRIITPRLGERRGWMALGGTPGTELRGRFYEVTRPSSQMSRPYRERDQPRYKDWRNWSFHEWSLAEVMALPDSHRWPGIVANWEEALETKRRNGWSDDNPIWQREYKGKWATDDTETVYKFRPHVDEKEWNIWVPPRVGPLQIAKLPDTYDDWNYGFGMDLGSKDPFALVVFAISPSDPTKTLYHVWEVESPGARTKVIAQICLGDECNVNQPAGLIGELGWPNGIVVDVASLGGMFLDELSNEYGIRAVPAARKPGEKYAAIALFNGDLLSGRIKISKGSKLAEHLGQLRWMQDEFRQVKEDKAQANHLTDAALYARQVLANLLGAANESATTKKAVHPKPVDEPQPRIRQDNWDSPRAPSVWQNPWDE